MLKYTHACRTTHTIHVYVRVTVTAAGAAKGRSDGFKKAPFPKKKKEKKKKEACGTTQEVVVPPRLYCAVPQKIKKLNTNKQKDEKDGNHKIFDKREKGARGKKGTGRYIRERERVQESVV